MNKSLAILLVLLVFAFLMGGGNVASAQTPDGAAHERVQQQRAPAACPPDIEWGCVLSGSTSPGLTLNSTATASNSTSLYATLTNPGSGSAAVWGRVLGSGSRGYGVYGSHQGSGYGVYGYSNNGIGFLGYSNTGTGMQGETFSTGNRPGILGQHRATTGTGAGVEGRTNSTSDEAAGVLGVVNSSFPGNSSAGVRGINNGTDVYGLGYGVWGSHAGEGSGVLGSSASGIGVSGGSADNYGVKGTSSNRAGVYGESRSTGDQPGVLGEHSATSGTGAGVEGRTNSTSAGAVGVLGVVPTTSAVSDSAGVRGINSAASITAAGVWGSHTGGGTGVLGTSPSGYGLRGVSTNNVGIFGYGGITGVYGNGNTYGMYAVGGQTGALGSGSVTGLWGSTNSNDAGATGVRGTANSQTGAVFGVTGEVSTTLGVAGYFLNEAVSTNTNAGVAVQGFAAGGSVAHVHPGGGFSDAAGEFAGRHGLIAASTNSGSGWGVIGLSNGTSGRGVYGRVTQAGGTAVYAQNTAGGRAGYFGGDVEVDGDLDVSGTVINSGGTTSRIDHPLDPENQYLSHSSVESPEMMNIYNGNVTTDANGDATVELPAYFQALNRDFRYQLTVIGQFAQAIVAEEIQGNRFRIKTDKPNVKVSWLVTGIRQDPWANENRVPVEEPKPEDERGTYLYPAGYGQPESRSVDYEQQRMQEMEDAAPPAPAEAPAR